MNAVLKSLENLGPQEKLQLVEDLWDSIEEETIPVMTDEIYTELVRRAAWSKAHPGRGAAEQDNAKKLSAFL